MIVLLQPKSFKSTPTRKQHKFYQNVMFVKRRVNYRVRSIKPSLYVLQSFILHCKYFEQFDFRTLFCPKIKLSEIFCK